MEKTELLRIIDNFFRDKPLDDEDLVEMRMNYKELLSSAETNGGCSKCERNSLRRRFRKFIVQVVTEKEKLGE
jgi:hypothetical protein